MTKNEYRMSTDYRSAYDKAVAYNKGFKFTINFSRIPKAKANALRILLDDLCKDGILESISIGYSLEDLIAGNITEETFVRR